LSLRRTGRRRVYDPRIPEPATTRPRQRRKPIEVRRREVLDAALQLVAAGGFASVTMEAVARQAALAKTVVYNAYPNRAELLEALLQREFARALETFAEALPGPGATSDDPLEAPLRWVGAIATAIQRDPTTWRLILLPPDEPPTALKASLQAGREVVLGHLREMIADVAEVRPRIARFDPDFLPHALLALCEEGSRRLIAEPEEYDPARVVVFARELLEAMSR
jgi:AcrR family transcriptional regulator